MKTGRGLQVWRYESHGLKESEPMSEDHRKDLSEEASTPSPGSPAPGSGMSRRGAIGWILGAGSAVIGVLLAIPLVRMAFYPLFANSGANAWSDAGSMSDYDSLQTPT